MKKYNGSDYKKYIKYTDDTYNRHIVENDNDLQVIVISWKAGQKTKIHDHPEGGCILRVLSGSLNETIYRNDPSMVLNTTLDTSELSYIDNSIGRHEIEALEDSVSMHVYSHKKPNVTRSD